MHSLGFLVFETARRIVSGAYDGSMIHFLEILTYYGGAYERSDVVTESENLCPSNDAAAVLNRVPRGNVSDDEYFYFYLVLTAYSYVYLQT